MNSHTMNRAPVLGSPAGRQLFSSRPIVARPSRSRGPTTPAAERTPSWKLEKPNRLWELGKTWYPGADAPEYLDGSLPGDRGFDPLRLFQNPDVRSWLVEGELYNGRIAMLAVVGVLTVEALGLGPWWTAPSRVAWPLPYFAGVVVSHLIWGTIELSRTRNFWKYGETGLLNQVPFDPLGLRNDGFRQKEVRNGRLAMLANLGFWSQAATTGKGPLDNLQEHIANPLKVNIYTNPKIGFEATIAAIFIGIAPIILEARKDLTPEDKRKEEAGYRPFPFL